MIGVNFGSLNSSIALGKAINPSLIFKTELLLSDTSLRTCPSIISYTSSHRLIGDHASLVIKKNMKSSFQYINRLIGFNLNIPFYQTEYNKYYYIGGNYNQDQKKFCALNDEMLYPEEIVISYLHLLYNSYILENNIECDYFVFSVPDYFNCFHKEAFKRIIEVINLKKEYSIINESSAITLYFGYKKYQEYFIRKNEGKSATIDPSITKYILFIDAGHSKVTFVLSKLAYNLFTVLDTTTIPFLGGRDFDLAIYKYCCDKFNQDNGIDISKNNKTKLRLLTPIMKARKTLTVNKDAQISVDSLSDDIDFSLLLTRENFEKLIQDKVTLFKQELINFINRNKKNYPNIDITNVEMAGELMRTPVLEKTVKEICKIEMSKTILTDECLSVGCSLYGALLKGVFPIRNFKGIYHLNHYSINSSINNAPINEYISNHYQIPEFKSFTFDKNLMQNNINVAFYHSKNEIKDYSYTESTDDNVLLVAYDIICSEIFKKYQNINQLKVTFLIDNIGEVHINKLESIINKDNTVKISLDKDVVKIVKRGLYLSQAQKNKIIAGLNYTEQNLFKIDQEFINFSAKKNSLEGDFYNVKNMIQNKSLTNAQYNGKNIMTCMQEIEDKLNDNYNQIFDLTPLEQYLDQIIQSITPKDIADEKNKILNEISGYQNRVNGISDAKERNDAVNMLLYFKKKLRLIVDMNELRNLIGEFNNEKGKYF